MAQLITLPYSYIRMLGDLALSTLGKYDLGTLLSLRQVKDHGGCPAGEDNEVTERNSRSRRERRYNVEPLDPAEPELPNYMSL